MDYEYRIEKQKNGNMYFSLNTGENLCGTVTISIDGAKNYKYLYLYNKSQEKYQLISQTDFSNLRLSSSGDYMLTNSRVEYSNIPWVFIIILVIAMLILICVYVVIKRKYWFW